KAGKAFGIQSEDPSPHPNQVEPDRPILVSSSGPGGRPNETDHVPFFSRGKIGGRGRSHVCCCRHRDWSTERTVLPQASPTSSSDVALEARGSRFEEGAVASLNGDVRGKIHGPDHTHPAYR